MSYLDSFYFLLESAVGLMEGCVEILIESKPSGYDSRPWMKTDTLPNILTGDFPLLLFLCP